MKYSPFYIKLGRQIMCKYMFYKELNGRVLLFCRKSPDKQDICGYSRICTEKNKAIPTEWRKCTLKDRKDMPNGAKLIKLKLKNYLYIDVGGKTVKILNTLGDFEQEYIYMEDGIDINDYKLSLDPIKKVEKITIKEEESIIEDGELCLMANEEKKTNNRRKINLENG